MGSTEARRYTGIGFSLFWLLLAGACGADQYPTSPAAPVVTQQAVLDPLAGTLIVSGPLDPSVKAPGTPGAPPQTVVFVSLPPGALGVWETVVIINARTRTIVTPSILLRGFDPVAVPARAGDTLDVATTTAGLGATHTRVVVTTARPLRVVRTDPWATSTVPIEAVAVVVFSEPLDPNTVTPGAIRIRVGSGVVAGSSIVDSTGTTVRITPATPLVSSTAYQVEVAQSVTGRAGSQLPDGVTVGFTTAPPGSSAGVAAITGVWTAVSWLFTNFNHVGVGGGYIDSEDPVFGWGPNYYYRIRLTITQASPTSVRWRWEETWMLGGPTGTDTVSGTATVGDGWMLGRTERSPWLSQANPCVYGDVCPMQSYFDYTRTGEVLRLFRRAYLLYIDDVGLQWPSYETLTLQRVGDAGATR